MYCALVVKMDCIYPQATPAADPNNMAPIAYQSSIQALFLSSLRAQNK